MLGDRDRVGSHKECRGCRVLRTPWLSSRQGRQARGQHWSSVGAGEGRERLLLEGFPFLRRRLRESLPGSPDDRGKRTSGSRKSCCSGGGIPALMKSAHARGGQRGWSLPSPHARSRTGLQLSQEQSPTFILLCVSVVWCSIWGTALLSKCEQKGRIWGQLGLQSQVDLVEARERQWCRWSPRR